MAIHEIRSHVPKPRLDSVDSGRRTSKSTRVEVACNKRYGDDARAKSGRETRRSRRRASDPAQDGSGEGVARKLPCSKEATDSGSQLPAPDKARDRAPE